MLTITENAHNHLHNLLEETHAPSNIAIRLFQNDNNLDVKLDKIQENDTKHEYEGRTLLITDDTVANLVNDKTLDIDTTEEGVVIKLY